MTWLLPSTVQKSHVPRFLLPVSLSLSLSLSASLPRSPAYSFLPSCWPFSSSLNQSTSLQCKQIFCNTHVFVLFCFLS